MKKFGVALITLGLLTACGNNGKPKPNIETSINRLLGGQEVIIYSRNGYSIYGTNLKENEDGSITYTLEFKQSE